MAQRIFNDGSSGDVVIRSGPPASGGGSGGGLGGAGNRVGASGNFGGVSNRRKKARKRADTGLTDQAPAVRARGHASGYDTRSGTIDGDRAADPGHPGRRRFAHPGLHCLRAGFTANVRFFQRAAPGYGHRQRDGATGDGRLVESGHPGQWRGHPDPGR